MNITLQAFAQELKQSALQHELRLAVGFSELTRSEPALAALLLDVFKSPIDAMTWCLAENGSLGGALPIDLIAIGQRSIISELLTADTVTLADRSGSMESDLDYATIDPQLVPFHE